jgi:hypothetical protein
MIQFAGYYINYNNYKIDNIQDDKKNNINKKVSMIKILLLLHYKMTILLGCNILQDW